MLSKRYRMLKIIKLVCGYSIFKIKKGRDHRPLKNVICQYLHLYPFAEVFKIIQVNAAIIVRGVISLLFKSVLPRKKGGEYLHLSVLYPEGMIYRTC